MTLLLLGSKESLWHTVVHEAEASCMIQLEEELEAYLVFLLIRYTNRPEIMRHVIANEFFHSFHQNRKKQQLAFQEMGDKCLIFSGLFPHIAEKRLVKISYFVNMGQAAYSTISRKSSDLYGMLAKQFVPLMDTLQAIRRYSKEFSDLLPLEAYELWNEAGSQRSLRVLKHYTQAIPKKTY